MKYLRTLIFLLIALCLALPCAVFADDCTPVGSGATQNITGPDSVCKQVYNGTGAELCVMTYSTQEWQSFYNNPPPSVTAIACPAVSCSSPCGTIANGATCTAYAASSVACGSTCSSQIETCSNGTLSPSNYAYSSCSVGSCASCAASGACPVTAHGNTCYSCTRSTDSWLNCNCGEGDGGCASPQVCGYSTCNNGTWTGHTIGNYTGCSCLSSFLRATPVLMADGDTKPISDLQIGDAVRGKDGVNHVVRLPSHITNEPIYGFNGDEAFVTGGHPFWTQEGWKAIDPSLTPKEHHGVKTTKLEVGDRLSMDNGEAFIVTSIDSNNELGTQEVFNPVVDGDNTYYANGYLVHNKSSVCP